MLSNADFFSTWHVLNKVQSIFHSVDRAMISFVIITATEVGPLNIASYHEITLQ